MTLTAETAGAQSCCVGFLTVPVSSVYRHCFVHPELPGQQAGSVGGVAGLFVERVLRALHAALRGSGRGGLAGILGFTMESGAGADGARAGCY